MRVLAHIHTFNDADIIDRTIEAVLRQTRPVDEILVVDNASTDGTLERPSLKNATVLRHPENLGTSGAVHRGIRFALEQDYDWIWVFDADSVPEPDALEKLLDLYAGLAPELAGRNRLSRLPALQCPGRACRGTAAYSPDTGLGVTAQHRRVRYYPCHFAIWSGCLYRLAAVRQIGLPNPDYMLDWGEGEYGYRVMKAGYKGFIHQKAVLHHNIRGHTSFTPVKVKFGPATFTVYEIAPIRCYYTCRNLLYFALYEFRERRLGLLRYYGVTRTFRPAALSAATEEPRKADPGLLSRDLARGYRQHRSAVLGPMRVLAHIHTFNDADIIDRPIEAVLRQTRPVDGVLIVDNASTDGTLERPSLKNATILRHRRIWGRAGPWYSGLRFAIEHDYDWIWVFDADSIPEPDALEKLLELYAGFPPTYKTRRPFSPACRAMSRTVCRYHGAVFTHTGSNRSRPTAGGALLPLSLHTLVWMPVPFGRGPPDRPAQSRLCARLGRIEYGYRVMKAGYKGFIHQDAILQHNIRGIPSLDPIEVKRGAATVTILRAPADPMLLYVPQHALFRALRFAENASGWSSRWSWTGQADGEFPGASAQSRRADPRVLSRHLARGYRERRGPVLRPMRVLAHIHTFNDADIIDRTIEAMLRQTRPVDEILVVDNASTDNTLEGRFSRMPPSCVTRKIWERAEPFTAVFGSRWSRATIGFGFSMPTASRNRMHWKSCSTSSPVGPKVCRTRGVSRLHHYNVQDGVEQHAGVFSRTRDRPRSARPEQRFYPCHVVIWSGCLYRLAAVRRIGLPNPDYMLDWGEGEYGYRVMRAGYKASSARMQCSTTTFGGTRASRR